MVGVRRANSPLKYLTPIAATALILLILLATSVPLMHWFSTQGVQAGLAEQQSLWQSHGIANYDFTVTRRCECPPPANADVEIQVRDGLVRSAESLGRSIEAERLPSTVAAVFDIVHQGLAADNDVIDVTYDDIYGFPRRIEIDPKRSQADDEVVVSILSFRPVRATD